MKLITFTSVNAIKEEVKQRTKTTTAATTMMKMMMIITITANRTKAIDYKLRITNHTNTVTESESH